MPQGPAFCQHCFSFTLNWGGTIVVNGAANVEPYNGQQQRGARRCTAIVQDPGQAVESQHTADAAKSREQAPLLYPRTEDT